MVVLRFAEAVLREEAVLIEKVVLGREKRHDKSEEQREEMHETANG